MSTELIAPNLIVEVSWEVCNKIGGIYTVLSSRAKTLQEIYKDSVVFIGPDFADREVNPTFTEVKSLLKTWRSKAAAEGLKVRVGRWNIPGRPIAILIDFSESFGKLNDMYGLLWQEFGVQSHAAYGDYDQACAFSHASSLVINSLVENKVWNISPERIIAHFNEWTTGAGLLMTQLTQPRIATVFTTHATSIGRSICGNNKPLYEYLSQYNGDKMSLELNMVSKHSLEKMTARAADCFTTVSQITAIECAELLDKSPDIITPNGFEPNFVPKTALFEQKRKQAREMLIEIASSLTGKSYADDKTMLVATSGRYEYKNKGIDLFIDALNRIRTKKINENTQILAFVLVPADAKTYREDLFQNIADKKADEKRLENPIITHELRNIDSDNIINQMRSLGMSNDPEDRVHLIFVPIYLNSEDKLFSKEYYDLLIGLDMTVFPSYYEPWGYTPLESIAFGVPTITTDLAGFGKWAQSICKTNTPDSGINVIHRTDFNQIEVSETIAEMISNYVNSDANQQNKARRQAQQDSKLAEWPHFINSYLQAYDIAFRNSLKRS
ncbi:MAG: glycosyltransferase [Bacteroidales bacterium]